ncbi:MAG: Lrp/AsnC ligand binding domain-containing protein [bacterium]
MVESIVLINAPAKNSGIVIDELKKIEQVKEAAAIYGEIDIYARIVAEDLDELDNIIMEKIQSVPSVVTTRTHIVVNSLRWAR